MRFSVATRVIRNILKMTVAFWGSVQLEAYTLWILGVGGKEQSFSLRRHMSTSVVKFYKRNCPLLVCIEERQVEMERRLIWVEEGTEHRGRNGRIFKLAFSNMLT